MLTCLLSPLLWLSAYSLLLSSVIRNNLQSAKDWNDAYSYKLNQNQYTAKRNQYTDTPVCLSQKIFGNRFAEIHTPLTSGWRILGSEQPRFVPPFCHFTLHRPLARFACFLVVLRIFCFFLIRTKVFVILSSFPRISASFVARISACLTITTSPCWLFFCSSQFLKFLLRKLKIFQVFAHLFFDSAPLYYPIP